MDISIVKGIVTGILLSLPFGPVGIYCIELTMLEGRFKGYSTALGMITIDVLYSFVSLLFLSKVENFVIKYESCLSLSIGIILMLIAIKKLMTKPNVKELSLEYKNIFQNYFTGLFFALANITSILIITAIFTSLKVYNDEGPLHIYLTLLGVLIGGSGLWFLTTAVVSYYRSTLTNNNLITAIKIVNLLLLFFSGVLIIKSLLKIF